MTEQKPISQRPSAAVRTPAEYSGTVDHRAATMDEVMVYLRETQAEVQPVLDYLRDK
ncbi:hypothetical protein [Jannaschia sp. LMIT008]|uniref:hypothetical protein n=1 Tax=Jannaschia maritima TaxID=3032585 RepID=UPI002811E376|nr:hypothetical protein [Jannaschia sp. LMIT008]